HIIGHWNYPTNTVKTIYVAASHCDAVELLVNGKSVGLCRAATNSYIFAFPQIKFEPGEISAVAKAGTNVVARANIASSREPRQLRLTPHPGAKGLLADGSDVVFFDVEVVDAQGRRCPTDESRVDFRLEGPGLWRGGYNSGRPHSVNNLWLYTECGIN